MFQVVLSSKLEVISSQRLALSQFSLDRSRFSSVAVSFPEVDGTADTLYFNVFYEMLLYKTLLIPTEKLKKVVSEAGFEPAPPFGDQKSLYQEGSSP